MSKFKDLSGHKFVLGFDKKDKVAFAKKDKPAFTEMDIVKRQVI